MVKFYRNIRVVEVGDGYLTGARGYRFYRFDIETGVWSYFGKISDWKFALLSRFRILSRLFRADVHFYTTLQIGMPVCIAKKGVFIYNEKSRNFEKSFHVTRGTRPLNICEDADGNIYFGEYFHNPDRDSVNIYKSSDYGRRWEIVYTFPAHSIRHIHGLHYML